MLKEVGLRCCTCTTYIFQLSSHTHPDVFITDPLEDDVRGELSAAILQKLGEVKQGSSIHEELSYHTPVYKTNTELQ